MNIIIQPYDARYQYQVIQLICSIQQQEFGINITPDQQPDLKNITTFYQQKKGNFLLALDDNSVIGTIALLDIGNHEAALRKMFVHKDFRGCGVAKQLLDVLLQWAYEKQMRAIYLGTTAAFIAAHKFYAKHGFIEITKNELPKNFPVMAVDSKFYCLRC